MTSLDRHIALAAAHVVRLVDTEGSDKTQLKASFLRHSSSGVLSVADLEAGLSALVEVGAVTVKDGRYSLSLLGRDLSSLGNEDAVEAVVLVMQTGADEEVSPTRPGKTFDDSAMQVVGGCGERIAMAAIRDQLAQVDRPDLAARVRRISLTDDTAGYDILAELPRENLRMYEVKASVQVNETFTFFVTRNEYNVSSQNRRQHVFLFIRVDDVETDSGEIVGWLNWADIRMHVPQDQGLGTWDTVRVTMSIEELIVGLPAV